MYRSALLPRPWAVLGLTTGPLVFASGIAAMFGLHDRVSVAAAIAALPETVWEGVLGIYLIVKGFKPSAIVSEPAQADIDERDRGVAASLETTASSR